MSKRPNFGLSSTAMAGNFALQQPGESAKIGSKPFDGFKTSQNTSKRPFDVRGGKASNTDYRQPMGHAALEKNLVDDLKDLDWELESMGNKPRTNFQSEANLKPNLFMKKKNFNDTGETKATVGTLGQGDDWDLPASKHKSKTIPVIKENTVEASEWNLGGVSSPPKKSKGYKAAPKYVNLISGRLK